MYICFSFFVFFFFSLFLSLSYVKLRISRRSYILFCRVSFDRSKPLAAPDSFNSQNEGRFTFPLDVPDCKPNFLECFLNSCGHTPSFFCFFINEFILCVLGLVFQLRVVQPAASRFSLLVSFTHIIVI